MSQSYPTSTPGWRASWLLPGPARCPRWWLYSISQTTLHPLGALWWVPLTLKKGVELLPMPARLWPLLLLTLTLVTRLCPWHTEGEDCSAVLSPECSSSRPSHGAASSAVRNTSWTDPSAVILYPLPYFMFSLRLVTDVFVHLAKDLTFISSPPNRMWTQACFLFIVFLSLSPDLK